MKNLILLLYLLSGYSFSKAMEPPPPPDTVGFAWRSQILQAPVVTGQTTAINILPNQQPFCFDKQIAVKLAIPGSVVQQCLYLDTKGGLIGHLKPKTTGTGLCDIKPDDPDFSFFIYGLKGNTYQYRNVEKKGGGLEHLVTTSNSQTYLYEPPASTNNSPAVLQLKNESRMYCNDKIKAKAYKYDGGNKIWFLFGQEFPPTLVWNKYIGNFGVGYLFTDKGLYIAMEFTYGKTSYKITSIEDVNTCFNPAAFQIMEDKFVTKRTEELTKERNKLTIEQSKLSSGNCVTERTALYDYKMEILSKQELNLQNSQNGNALQNAQTQNSIIGMFDPLMLIHQGILETKVSVCKAMINATQHPGDIDAQDKITCLNNYVVVLQGYETRMHDVELLYSNNLTKAYLEKSKLYSEALSLSCH